MRSSPPATPPPSGKPAQAPPDTRAAADSRPDPASGTDPDTESGTHPDTESGTHPDADPGTPPDAPGGAGLEAPAAAADDDPNRNLVYEVVLELDDLEALGQLKWDLFRIESLLRRAVETDARVRRTPALSETLQTTLEALDADEAMSRYRQRFVRDAERLKHDERVGFYDLALRVRQQLHPAYAAYLEHVHDELADELEGVDTEGLVQSARVLAEGVHETRPRHTHVFVVQTRKSTREVLTERHVLDWSRIIARYERRIPHLTELVSQARLLYAHKGMAEDSVALTRDVRGLVRWIAVLAGAACLAAGTAAGVLLFEALTRG